MPCVSALSKSLSGSVSPAKHKLSASTQRQALNAVVYLFREVVGREPGDFSGLEVSRRPVRVPTVLTVDECRMLFSKMQGSAIGQ